MGQLDLGFNRQNHYESTYSSKRENDIKRLKNKYAISEKIIGSKMDHYVIVDGEIFNGFGLEEAKKILSISNKDEKINMIK